MQCCWFLLWANWIIASFLCASCWVSVAFLYNYKFISPAGGSFPVSFTGHFARFGSTFLAFSWPAEYSQLIVWENRSFVRITICAFTFISCVGRVHPLNTVSPCGFRTCLLTQISAGCFTFMFLSTSKMCSVPTPIATGFISKGILIRLAVWMSIPLLLVFVMNLTCLSLSWAIQTAQPLSCRKFRGLWAVLVQKHGNGRI